MTPGAGRREFSESGYNYRLYLPYLMHVSVLQAVIAVSRVATSYRTIELDLPVFWLGAISGSFAVLPMVLAVPLGRWLDRGRDAEAVWVGSFFILLACIGLWLTSGSQWTLIMSTALLGVGHLCIMAGHQTLALRCAEPRHRDAVFGSYMVLVAIGQGAGPLLVGWYGQGLKIAPSEPLFRLCVYASAFAFVTAFSMYRAPPAPPKSQAKPRVPIRDLLAIQGFTAMMLASVMTVTSLDLLIVYLPLLGTERNIEAGVIGILLTIRSVTTMVARMFFLPMVRLLGRVPLMVVCLVAGGVAFILMGLPVPVWLLGVATVLLGFGMGVAATLALSSVVELAPAEAQGSAVTLRITGNRVGQVTLPMLGGLIAAAAGAAGIMAIIGAALCLTGAAVAMSRRRA